MSKMYINFEDILFDSNKKQIFIQTICVTNDDPK